jgi:hypothetical protein
MASISHIVEQTLLADIENTGIPLDQLSLVDICDAKEGIYGAPGRSRRPVQLRFQKIKELTPRNYRKLLAKHNITPGPATLAAKQQEPAQELPDQASTAQESEEELVLSDDEEEVTTDEDKDIDIDLASAFQRISVKSKSSEMFSPEKTPTKNAMFSPTSGASPVGQSTADMTPSSTEDHTTTTAYDDTDPAIDALDFRRQCGTKSRPYIILADPSHPEHNFPFDITPFEGVEYNDYDHNGFHIRMAVASPDMNAWQAFIPSSKEFPKLASLIGRAVMVKGPSRNYWMSDAEMYHKKGIDCQVTKTAHEKTDTAIKADPNRQTSFFFIVFHKGLILDNYIFSGNSTILQMWKNGMKLDPDHASNPFKTKKLDVIGMCVWWRVGTAGGTRIRDGKAEEDADDLFD